MELPRADRHGGAGCQQEQRVHVDDRRVISGIVYVIRNGLKWKDAPRAYGPHKTLYNRFVRWSRLGVFARIFAALAGEAGEPERLMIDATHLKAHRTAASLLKKGLLHGVSAAPKAASIPSCTPSATGTAAPSCCCSPKDR